jgi:FkbM family methyltransferase
MYIYLEHKSTESNYGVFLMKLKEYLYYLGLRPSIKQYSYDIIPVNLEKDGFFQYASWQHPKQLRVSYTQKWVDALREFIHEGDAVIDIGAHAGDVSIPMALAAGPTGAVFAFEPNPYVYKILLPTTALNRKKTNIIPINFAIAEEDGEMEFEYSDSGFCNGGYHYGIAPLKHGHFFKLKVNCIRLMPFLEREYPEWIDKIRFVKIDAEGYDFMVFKSIIDLINRTKPFIRSEIYKHTPKETREDFFRTLFDHGYTIYLSDQEDVFQKQKLDISDVMIQKHYDIFAIPDSKS